MTTKNANLNDILKNNGLDFHIVKVPLMGVLPSSKKDKRNGTTSKNRNVDTPYFGLFNTKTKEIINTVKESYTVSQNKDIVRMVLKGSEQFGELSVHKAGSLHGGRKVFIQLGIEGNAKVGNDTIKRYITIIDSNDGSTGLSVGIGDLTMSCSNQFFQFYKNGTMKARHTTSIESKIKELPYLISDALNESMKLIEVYNEFQSTAVSRNLAHEMVNYLLNFDRTSPDSVLNDLTSRSMNMMDSLYTCIDTEMNGKGNNLWGLHSGVTRWTTHEKSAPRRENGRLESSMLGTNYKVNQKSLEFANNVLDII